MTVYDLFKIFDVGDDEALAKALNKKSPSSVSNWRKTGVPPAVIVAAQKKQAETGEGEMLREDAGGGGGLDEDDQRILAQLQGLTPAQKRTVADLISDYKLVQELKQERANKCVA